MIAEIKTGLSSLQTALGLAKTLNAAATQAAINDVKLELQDHIFAARQALAAADDRIRELEQQIVQFEHWEGEKKRYRLRAIDVHAFAYMLEPGMENGEPPHWLCQPCFENRKRSVLQFLNANERAANMGIQARWGCSVCKGGVSVYFQREPAIPWEPKAAT